MDESGFGVEPKDEAVELVSDAWAFGFIAIGIVILLLSFYLGYLFGEVSCLN